MNTEKTTLILPPYPEFQLSECGKFGILRRTNKEALWHHTDTRIFFCTGAAMWLEEKVKQWNRGGMSCDFFATEEHCRHWLDAAFGRILLDQIVFEKNDEDM